MQFSNAKTYMSTEYTERVELDWKKSLSVLFNCFIWCQVRDSVVQVVRSRLLRTAVLSHSFHVK